MWKPWFTMIWKLSLSEALSTAFSISANRIGERSNSVIGQPKVASTNASPAKPAVVSRMLGVTPDFNPIALHMACPRPPPNCCRCASEPWTKSIEIAVFNCVSNNSMMSSWNNNCKSYCAFFLGRNGSEFFWQNSFACCCRNFEKQITAIEVSDEVSERIMIYLLQSDVRLNNILLW